MAGERESVRRLMVAINRVDGIWYLLARKSGMKVNTISLLFALDDGKAHTQKQICEEWIIPRTTINTVVKECVELGYVELEQIDRSKEKLVRLTEKGMQYTQQVLELFYRSETKQCAEPWKSTRPILLILLPATLIFYRKKSKRNHNRKESTRNKMQANNVMKKVILCVIGSGILAFGLYNIHALSGVTEGGVLGMTLLLNHWLHISPAVSGFVMNAACYLLGWKLLGKSFIFYSAISGGCFSLIYAIVEQFPPLWPQLAQMPLVASLLGAVFVGVGVGLCVRAGGAPGGDDALAMSVCKVTHWDIRWAYLASDLIVLLLSLSYLDFKRIALSLLTVLLSGQIIGIVQLPIGSSRKRQTAEGSF